MTLNAPLPQKVREVCKWMWSRCLDAGRWGPQQNLAGFMSGGALVAAVLSEPPSKSIARVDGMSCCQSCSTAPMAKPGCESCHVSSEVTLMGNGQSELGCVYVARPLLWGPRVVCYSWMRWCGNCSVCSLHSFANQCNRFGFGCEASQSHSWQ